MHIVSMDLGRSLNCLESKPMSEEYNDDYLRTSAEVKTLFIQEFASTGVELTLETLKPIFIGRYGSLDNVPQGVREGVTSGIMHGRQACDLS